MDVHIKNFFRLYDLNYVKTHKIEKIVIKSKSTTIAAYIKHNNFNKTIKTTYFHQHNLKM